MATPRTQRRLIYGAIFLMLFSIFMSLFTFWYLIHHQESVNTKLQMDLRQELEKYNIPQQQPLSIDDAKLLIAVAKYCEAHDGCKGRDGQTIQGPVGPLGLQGIMGDSIQGPKGETGNTGATGAQGDQGVPGQDGAPGRTLEQRCVVVNETKRRIEQKYTDSETWEALYYLSRGQLCPEEVIL